MSFLSEDELAAIPFRRLGRNVRISRKASIYSPERMAIGDHSRVDDFCVLSGRIEMGRNCHVAVFCNVAGGVEGVFMDDFSGLAYSSQAFTQSDDYSGKLLTNPTVPIDYRGGIRAAIHIGRHCIVGASSVVLPGVVLAEGTAVGAMSLVTKSTQEWSVYFGIPARRIKARQKDLLELERAYLNAETVAGDGCPMISDSANSEHGTTDERV